MLSREESQSLEKLSKTKKPQFGRCQTEVFLCSIALITFCRIFMGRKVIAVGAAHKNFNDLSACC